MEECQSNITNMDIIVTLLVALLTAFLAYNLGVRQDKNRALNELRINLAADFIQFSFYGLRYLKHRANFVEAEEHTINMLKKSEAIGIFFDEKIYNKTTDFVEAYNKILNDYKTNATIDYKKEQSDLIAILKQIRIDFTNLFVQGYFK